MRTIANVVCLSLLLGGTAAAQTAPVQPPTPPAATASQPTTTANPNQLLDLGKTDYRAGQYAKAVDELRAASTAFLSPEEKQRYIDTGKLETLPQVEQSLVYLALAYAKLGKDNEARDAVMRLANAERIAPTFAALPLEADAADFQPLVARLAPTLALPQNAQLAQVSGTASVTVAQSMPPATPSTATAAVTQQSAPAAASPVAQTAAPAETPAPPAQVAQATAPPPSQSAAERAEIMKQVEEQVAEAKAQIEREAAAKIAGIQKAADERVAAEHAAADRAAQEKIAAERAEIQRQADEKIAADRAAIEKAAAAQVAEARAAAQREAEEKIAAERAAAERDARLKIESADADQHRAMLVEMRQAESLAERGNTDAANRAWVRLASAADSPRDVIASSATGLYRTHDFADAVNAFRRLGAFARGEEDLRYYYAVSLFETGRFDDAKRELACALPYIEVTNDVDRYRVMIERMPPAPVAR